MCADADCSVGSPTGLFCAHERARQRSSRLRLWVSGVHTNSQRPEHLEITRGRAHGHEASQEVLMPGAIGSGTCRRHPYCANAPQLRLSSSAGHAVCFRAQARRHGDLAGDPDSVHSPPLRSPVRRGVGPGRDFDVRSDNRETAGCEHTIGGGIFRSAAVWNSACDETQ